MPFDTGGKYTMESYKSEFIEFMVESDVLKFGDFTLKSGRKSPFFMNAGAYVTGSQLKKLGEYYAKAIHASYGDDFDVLFGPAYKGIPLAVVTAIAFSELYGKEIRYCSDRKEATGYLAIALGALAWWFGITFFVNKVRTQFNLRGIWILNRIIGGIVIVVSVFGLVFTLMGESLY